MDELRGEFEGSCVGDERRLKRLLRVVGAAEEQPDASFPNMMGSEAALEGLYRLLGNPAVDPDGVVEGHRMRTAERSVAEGSVVVVHDTTSFQFAHADPREVGFLQTGKPGFYGHFSLAVSATGSREPLGVVGLETLFRNKRSRHRSRHMPGSATTKQKDNESKRWEDGVRNAERLLAAVPERVHVADREADSYRFLAALHQGACRFVVRVRHDRRARDAREDAQEPWTTLKALAGSADTYLTREVSLSSRSVTTTAPRQARSHPARQSRVAKLHYAATSMVVQRPKYFDDSVATELRVNIVRVYEPNPPVGQEPVEWLLATTEPVDTAEDVSRIVDLYRTRWVIEEFFKALKSGCLYEERHLESRHALLNALAIFAPLACKLLWLRSRAQVPDVPALDVITKQQLQVLRAIAKRPLSQTPTARDVLWSIAGLGGHLKRNGEPGWATIRRGFERLLLAEVGWTAARTRRKM
jgi:IS4 transposase